MVGERIRYLMKHLVGRLTVKGYQLSQFGLGGLVVAAETFVDCDVFFFKITQVFEGLGSMSKSIFSIWEVLTYLRSL